MMSSKTRKKLSGVLVIVVSVITIIGLSDLFFVLPEKQEEVYISPEPTYGIEDATSTP